MAMSPKIVGASLQGRPSSLTQTPLVTQAGTTRGTHYNAPPATGFQRPESVPLGVPGIDQITKGGEHEEVAEVDAAGELRGM